MEKVLSGVIPNLPTRWTPKRRKICTMLKRRPESDEYLLLYGCFFFVKNY
jgi:hypothetical protein